MICAKCGQEHPIEEMELTFRRPDDAATLSSDERARRVQESSDLCIVDNHKFFIRCVLPLPVAGRERPYNIGLWVQVSQDTFQRIYDLWDSEDQHSEPPLEATIANEIPTSDGILGHKAWLYLAGPGTRPNVLLEKTGHPLSVEQAKGIDAHRVSEYTALFT